MYIYKLDAGFCFPILIILDKTLYPVSLGGLSALGRSFPQALESHANLNVCIFTKFYLLTLFKM